MPAFFRSRGFRWGVIAPVMLIAFVVSAGFVSFHLIRAAATPERDRIVAELDSADPNWRTVALTAERNARLPPPEQNAAELGYRAYQMLPKAYRDWEGKADAAKWRAEVTNPHLPHRSAIADTRKHLRAAKESLELARSLRHVPGGGFGWEYREPDILGTSLEKHQHLRMVMSLLSFDAAVRAYDRDDDGALDSCLAILAVARGLGDDPWLISQLIRMAGVAITVGATERTLAWGGRFDDAKLAEVDKAFETEAAEPRLLYGLRGERAMFFRICENIDSGAMDADALTDARRSATSRLQSAPLRARIPDNQAVGLGMYTRLIEAAKLPPGNARRTALGEVENDYFRQLRAGHVYGPLAPHILVGLLLPATQKMNESDTRTVASLNAARVAIACERHRLKTGAYPEKLDELPKELLAEVPTDPFSGKPILYKKLADGVVAYSTGGDGTDDGAVKLDPKTEKGNDLGFRLWTPAHRRRPPLSREATGSADSFVFSFDTRPKGDKPAAPPPLSPRVKEE
jgi:hypothetical protein